MLDRSWKLKSVLHMAGACAALGSDCRPSRHAAGVLLQGLRRHPVLQDLACHGHPLVSASEKCDRIASAVALCDRIAALTARLTGAAQSFVFFSGDHSQAMGVWRGVLDGLGPRRQLGLLWIDAHLDAHTPCTSPSDNLHGMPVAALLGVDDLQLRRFVPAAYAIAPECIHLVGARSHEPPELALLEGLGVRIHDMSEVRRHGLAAVLTRAWNELAAHSDSIGISLDLDAVDPVDAPGVAVPVSGGISGSALIDALAELPRPIALEIAEFNPQMDHRGRTLSLVARVIGQTFSRNKANRFLGSRGWAIRSTSRPTACSRAKSYSNRNAL